MIDTTYETLADRTCFYPAAGHDVPADAYGKIVLKAGTVQTAIDIEAAIVQATNWGTRPGLVILDGRDGPFEFSPEVSDFEVNNFGSGINVAGTDGCLTFPR